MSHIKFDYKTALPFVALHEFDYLQPAVTAFDAALLKSLIMAQIERWRQA